MLILGSGISVWLLLFGGAVALALVCRVYWRVLGIADYGVWLPRALLGLRVAAVLLCLAMVANPILRINAVPRDKQRIVVLVDASRSMSVKDSIGGESRLDSARRILTQQGVLAQLDSIAPTQVKSFDSDVRPAVPAQIVAAGESSDLESAIRKVSEDDQKKDLRAIVILTDGCETGAKKAAELTPSVPIYTVGLGSLNEALVQFPDVALTEVKAEREVLTHTQVTATITLSQTNLDGERVTVQIVRGDQVLDEQNVELKSNTKSDNDKGSLEIDKANDATTVTLHFTPTDPGLYDLEARVLPHPKEKITENNGRFFSVRVTDKKLRVFYYEGTPRNTGKYMLKELKRDAQLALMALVRTNPDSMYVASDAGGGSIFPTTRDALKIYDCIILGEVRGTDISQEQAEAIRQYVMEDGGGLILLGGRESFSASGLPMLGLNALMPAGMASVKELSGTFDLSITQEGSVHPALGGVETLLPVTSVFVLGEPKPGAEVLVRANSDKGSYPIVFAQHSGNGKIFVFATNSDWNWAMKLKEKGGDALYGKFWGQAIRWVSKRELPPEQQAAVTLSTERDVYKINEEVSVVATGTGIGPLKEVVIAPPPPLATAQGGKSPETERIAFSQNKKGAGLVASFVPKQSGLHRVTAGGATCEFLVERPTGEFDRLALDDGMLRQLARKSGGQYFDVTTARNLPESLRLSARIKTEIREYVFDNSWIPFVMLVLALGAEWTLRKRMQVI